MITHRMNSLDCRIYRVISNKLDTPKFIVYGLYISRYIMVTTFTFY